MQKLGFSRNRDATELKSVLSLHLTNQFYFHQKTGYMLKIVLLSVAVLSAVIIMFFIFKTYALTKSEICRFSYQSLLSNDAFREYAYAHNVKYFRMLSSESESSNYTEDVMLVTFSFDGGIIIKKHAVGVLVSENNEMKVDYIFVDMDSYYPSEENNNN
jgi:hypothetical protein